MVRFEVERQGSKVVIHQQRYIRDLLNSYECIEGESNVPAVREPNPLEDGTSLQELVKRAQTLAGQLLWVAGRTRPDIAYAVRKVRQNVTKNPAEAICRAETVLRYLRRTVAFSVVYDRAPNEFGKWDQRRREGLVEAYADASLDSDADSKSYGASQLFWAGSIVCWVSQEQPLIAASTAEAELIALTESHALGRAMLPTIQALLCDRLTNVEPVLYTDNAAADAGAWGTRHLRLRGGLIRQCLETQGWKASHIDGVHMCAEIGTKAVGPMRLWDLIGMISMDTHGTLNPKAARMTQARGGIVKVMLALLCLTQVQQADGQPMESGSPPTRGQLMWNGFCWALEVTLVGQLPGR